MNGATSAGTCTQWKVVDSNVLTNNSLTVVSWRPHQLCSIMPQSSPWIQADTYCQALAWRLLYLQCSPLPRFLSLLRPFLMEPDGQSNDLMHPTMDIGLHKLFDWEQLSLLAMGPLKTTLARRPSFLNRWTHCTTLLLRMSFQGIVSLKAPFVQCITS